MVSRWRLFSCANTDRKYPENQLTGLTKSVSVENVKRKCELQLFASNTKEIRFTTTRKHDLCTVFAHAATLQQNGEALLSSQLGRANTVVNFWCVRSRVFGASKTIGECVLDHNK